MFGLTTRYMQLILDGYSIIPIIHLIINLVLLLMLWVDAKFVKIVYKWYFFIQFVFGVLGILSFLILFVLRENYDEFSKLYLHIFHAILGGILYFKFDKYFIHKIDKSHIV